MHEKATGKHNIFYLSKIIYNTYKLYICINNLNEVIVFEMIMLSSRCRLTKITAPNMTGFFFFLSCWSVQSSDYWCCSWWPPRTWRRVLMLKTPDTWNTEFRKVKLGLTMQATKMGWGKSNQFLHLSVLPTNHNNDQHDKMSQNLDYWDLILSGKQQTCSWI